MIHNLSFKNLPALNGLYGLVVCGGKSSRMGMDKSMLDYHGKPQCYHIYEMLGGLCEKVIISCSEQQAELIDPEYETLIDLEYYCDIGPMAALLSAFTTFPHNDFLIIGCDYPFLNKNDLADFLSFCNKENPSSFYNAEKDIYEPMLAYYDHHSKMKILEMFKENHHSLQHFLKENNAAKFYPENKNTITSVDTMKDFLSTKKSLNKDLIDHSVPGISKNEK